jgi:tRNA-specific 2-thiouridylase
MDPVTQTKEKVLVAMSGGVDSSVAAHLLAQAGYEVTGVFLRMREGPGPEGDAADARRVAEALGIELLVLEAAGDFARIIDYFVAEYSRGRTPNPCVHCNALVKFGLLVARADERGARWVATGHHARIADGAIRRAAGKDQSYALFGVPRGFLERMLLPIGDFPGKAEVRGIAAGLGLPVAEKPESQDICFVSGRYVELLRRRPEALRPGNIVDLSGHILGRHDGVGHFTVGQRRGLGVAVGRPMYVTRIDPATATVTIGSKQEVTSSGLSASAANWHVEAPAAGGAFEAMVQIRYHHEPSAGRVRITGPDTFQVEFAHPVAAVTPGQAAVVYDGDRLLGGGWID